MKGKQVIIAFWLLFFMAMTKDADAQNFSRISRDSLKRIIKNTAMPDSARMNSLFRLARTFDYSSPDSLLFYAEILRKEAEKTHDPAGMAMYYDLEGLGMSLKGKNKEALNFHIKALEIADKLNDEELLRKVCIELGCDYNAFEILDKSLFYFNKALDISNKLKQPYKAADALLNLALVYDNAGDVKKSIEYNRRILTLYDSLRFDDPVMKAAVLHNLAENLMNTGKNEEALKYLLQAYNLNKQNNNRYYLKINLNLLGNLFSSDKDNKLARLTDDKRTGNQLAFYYYNELKTIAKEDKDTGSLITFYLNISELYSSQGNYKEALKSLLKSLDLNSRHQDAANLESIEFGLANVYYLMGDYKKSYEFFNKRITLGDSLANLKITEKVNRLSDSHEIALRDEQLKIKEQQLKDKQNIIYLFITLVAVVLVFAFFMFYAYKQKQRAAKILALKNREIEEARARAERNEKFKEQFLANMSHEIRTPLNTVIGITDLMLDEKHTPKNEGYLKNVKQAGEHLLEIINDILDLSKVEAGKLDLLEAPFNLDSFISEIKDLFQYKIQEKNLQLITRAGDEVPRWLSGDCTRIRQVLVNLVGNAVKFTEKGSVRIKIEADELSRDQCKLRFSVEDTGPGIAKDQLALIFEEFVQAQGTNEQVFRGTGLGLSISRKLVERMGGKLQVESQPGAGSVFSFTIPLGISSEEALTEYRKESVQPAEAREGAFRILIVEDNPSNVIVTEGHLEKILPEAKLAFAGNGFEALDLLNKEQFDLVLMDVQMPGMDGYETTLKIRELPDDRSKVPVIALTASVIRADIQRCLEAGMNAYVPKPINRKVLAGTIFEQLGIKAEDPFVTSESTPKNFLDEILTKPLWTSSLYEACNGKKSRFTKYLELFLVETEKELSTWDVFINEKQNEKLAASIHKLNYHIRIFTSANTYTSAIILEEQLRMGWNPEYAERLTELQESILIARKEAQELLINIVPITG